ncbi:MAG: glycosyltransferase family 2 protein [Lachnospiraceae bacterium]|nr:glycosyltransferase family 2 protein [Lachnospiraceae bacterium]
MREVAAVVVTYNRKVLLKECLKALLDSEEPLDIIIVDNNSTDGTKDYISDLICDNDNVTYKHLKKNMGGAGGFSAGISYAVRRGYKYVWIMDDDTIIKKDSLKRLMGAATKLYDNFGFLSSTVKWTDGSDCVMNRQTYEKNLTSMQQYYKNNGLTPVKAATFVSLLFNADAVRYVGLPKREYFIWGDDKEYTIRMSKNFNCYNVVDSEVVHKMTKNSGSNITLDKIDRIDRYFYAYRNDFCTARNEGVKELLIYMAGFALNFARVILFAKDNKIKRLGTMLKGLKAGVLFNPRIRFVRNSDT